MNVSNESNDLKRTRNQPQSLGHLMYTLARQTYHCSVRIGQTLDPDFPMLELKTFKHISGMYPADKYCGSWPRQSIRPDQLFQ